MAQEILPRSYLSLLIAASLVISLAATGPATSQAADSGHHNAGDDVSSVKKQSTAFADNKLFHEGTVLIPGIGRYMIGSHRLPSIHGLDHSIPAASHPRYIPGNDDTFVPNPGYEVPIPGSRGQSNLP
ncbi:hypothetical protein KSP40_PGU014394 [Platanthera guangdongensis]|uniref:Cell wall protein n=1 Tax=Platanthera guangdongensis TaxID=2320717 RepID=A0ABR2MDL5_9ASPA